MSDEVASAPGKLKLTIKTPSTNYEIEVDEGATVGDVKRELTSKTSQPIDKHTLIFSGKILKDELKLVELGIKDGMTVHLVIRTVAAQAAAQASSSSPQAPRAAPTATATPSGGAAGGQASPQNPFGGLGGLGGLGGMAGMGNPMAMLNNPEMMSQMMNSPMMQSLLNNPDIIRSMVTQNPQMQQLMESNPELGHLLNDPDMMRQMTDMIRNPSAFNEMMRNHDQAIRNLQGIPGGEAALERLYQEVQEPLLNSATSSLGGNPFAALRNDTPVSSRSQNAGVENAEALPNPWGGSGGNGQGGAEGAAGQGAFGSLPGFGSLLDSPGMQSMMNQMMADPNLMSQMFTPEVMASMSSMINSNPQLIETMINSSPLTASNPALAEQMRSTLPQLMQNGSFSSMLQSMQDPEIINAMRQVQQGFETIRLRAPHLMTMFGLPTGLPPAAGLGGGAGGAAGGAQGGAAGGAPGAGPNPQDINIQQLQQLMGSLNFARGGLGGLGGLGGAAGGPPPEQRFSNQLEQLQSMGFTDQAANIAALLASFGDVNGAIERLLQR